MAQRKKAKAQPEEPQHGATPQDITIHLRGKEYHLVFTYRALEVAEQKLAEAGHHVNMLLTQDLRSVGATRLPFLFFAALVSRHPEITFAEAKALIDLRSNMAIYGAVCDAYVAGMARAKSGDADSARPIEQPSE